MKINYRLSLAFILSITVFCSFPVYANFFLTSGQTGAEFLIIPVSARASALGGAYAAVSGTADSLEYNPAGISFVKENQILLAHSIYFRSANYSSVTMVPRPFEHFGFGFRYRTLYANDVQRDEVGANLGDTTIIDQGVTGAISYGIFDILSFGFSVELLERKLFDIISKGIVYSFGAQCLLFDRKHSLGISLQNLGAPTKFVDKMEEPPTVLRFGGSHGFIGKPEQLSTPVIVNWELQKFSDDKQVSSSVGAEVRFYSIFILRGGGQLRKENIQFSGGLGLSIGRMAIDYALRFRQELGMSNSANILFRF